VAFGSEILVIRHGGVFAWASLIGGLGLLGIAAFFWTPAWHAAAASIFFGTFGAIFVLGGTALLTTVFEFYETGFIRRTLFNHLEVPYRELNLFVFSEVRRYAEGIAYTGTAVDIVFITQGGSTLRFHTARIRRPVDLQNVRDRISLALAERMLETAGKTGSVEWAGATLKPTEIRAILRKRFSPDQEFALPISRNLSFRFHEGALQIFVPGNETSALELSTAAPNFFPGFVLFQRYVQSAAA
jgi:hypothetical protein